MEVPIRVALALQQPSLAVAVVAPRWALVLLLVVVVVVGGVAMAQALAAAVSAAQAHRPVGGMASLYQAQTLF